MFRLPFGRPPLTPEEYQRHVLTLLRDRFPDRPFVASANPFVIESGEVEFGLQNLYATYEGVRLGRRARDQAILDHFSRMQEGMRRDAELRGMPWATARPLLRPQFMPPEYSSSIPVLTFPFTEDVLVALVTDYADMYSYVRVEDGERWGQSPAALYEVAIANLDGASAGVEMHVGTGADRFVGIEARDGYDAARLLLPGIRANVVERLGSPCLAVIPNRDFLFFWAADNSPDFHAFARKKTAADHRAQPYPLTDAVFSVTREDVTRVPDL